MKIKADTVEGVLIRAANRYASARADLSWQGAQDPADRGTLRREAKRTKEKLERLCFAVAEALKQKESNRAN